MIKEVIGHFKPTSTFGWTPLACAAGLKTLKVHQRDKVWEQTKVKGDWVMETLKKELSDHPKVGNIRGMGLEIAIDTVVDKDSKETDEEANTQILEEAFKQGIHLADAGDCTQLMPPLTMEQDVLEASVHTLIKIIKDVK